MQGITGAEWFGTLQKAMDLLLVQNRVSAGNVANVNTPAYSRQAFNFQQELERCTAAQSALESGVELRPPNGSAAQTETGADEEAMIETDTTSPRRADGNNVVMENEMVEMAQANEMYTALARIATKNFKMARYIISGGR
jgi:flagellar basal-body rod protein FlgB